MDKKFDFFLKNIKDLNNTINFLLEDGGIVKEPYTGESKRYLKTLTYEVVDVGELYHEKDNPTGLKNNPPNENYMEIDLAREYDPDVEIGDTIKVETVDFEDMTVEEIMEWAMDQNLTVEEMEQILVAGPSTVRVGGQVIRLGPKGYRKAKRGIESALFLKKFFDRYGKKIKHSRCWCLGVVKDFIDPSTEEPSRVMFEGHISEFIKPVEEELLGKWDFCMNKYGNYLKKKDDRQKTTEECITIDQMWEDQQSTFNTLVNLLQSAFKVKGIDIQKDATPGNKSDSSVAEKIVAHKKMVIQFESDVTKEPEGGGSPVVIIPSGSSVKFEIVGTYKNDNNTVYLKSYSKWGSGSDKYKDFILSFSSATVKKRQSNNLIFFQDAAGEISKKKSTWSGYIDFYKD